MTLPWKNRRGRIDGNPEQDDKIMHPWPLLIAAFISGAVLAALYLYTLWFTVQRIGRGRHPALWLAASLVARLGVLAAAFYFILGEGHWERLLAALAGFVLLRTITLRRVRRHIPQSRSEQGKAV